MFVFLKLKLNESFFVIGIYFCRNIWTWIKAHLPSQDNWTWFCVIEGAIFYQADNVSRSHTHVWPKWNASHWSASTVPAQHCWPSDWIETSTQPFDAAGVLSSWPYLERLSPLRHNGFCWRSASVNSSQAMWPSPVWKFELPSDHKAAPPDVIDLARLCVVVTVHTQKWTLFASRHRYVTLRRCDASLCDSTKVCVGLTDLQAWLWFIKGPVCFLFRLCNAELIILLLQLILVLTGFHSLFVFLFVCLFT